MSKTELITKENELFELWKKCFEDENSIISSFFDYVYDGSLCVSEERDGTTVSAFHLIPCEYHRKKCLYLYAAATLPEYREQGIMTQLVGRAEKIAKMHNAAFIYIYPANESLYQFYKKLGFSRVIPAIRVVKDRDELPVPDSVQRCGIREFFALLRKNARLFHAPVPEKRVLPYLETISDNAVFSYCVRDGELCALAACEKKEGTAVSLFADARDGCYEELLASFAVFGEGKYEITAPACLNPDGQTEDNGMLMPFSGNIDIQRIYTGFNML